jgi:hypothetical protein
LAWLPLDLVALNNGWPVARCVALIAVHLAIGLGGLLTLRAGRMPTELRP